MNQNVHYARPKCRYLQYQCTSNEAVRQSRQRHWQAGLAIRDRIGKKSFLVREHQQAKARSEHVVALPHRVSADEQSGDETHNKAKLQAHQPRRSSRVTSGQYRSAFHRDSNYDAEMLGSGSTYAWRQGRSDFAHTRLDTALQLQPRYLSTTFARLSPSQTERC